jgi:hypothetical protein
MFSARIDELTLADIERVWSEQWAESSSLELKETIPTEDGSADRWITRGDRIGDYGKQKILREIVAFANAHGGTLIVGVEETSSKPARAEKPIPLPKCKELAERLRRTFRDDVEPRLPFVECEGVEINGQDGVVVIRVPTSPVGPHWVRSSREPTYRRGDESVVMTMTEVQDLTIRLSQANDERRKLLEELSLTFLSRFDSLYPGYFRELETLGAGRVLAKSCIALRCSAIPVAPLVIAQVATRPKFRAVTFPAISARTASGSGNLNYPSRWRTDNWRPHFRCTRTEEHDELGSFERSVDSRGVIDLRWMAGLSSGKFYLSWIVYSVALVLLHIDQVRLAADAAETPYALEIEMRALGEVLAAWSEQELRVRRLPSHLRFPLMEVGDSSSHKTILEGIQYDYWTAAGEGNPKILEIVLA